MKRKREYLENFEQHRNAKRKLSYGTRKRGRENLIFDRENKRRRMNNFLKIDDYYSQLNEYIFKMRYKWYKKKNEQIHESICNDFNYYRINRILFDCYILRLDNRERNAISLLFC